MPPIGCELTDDHRPLENIKAILESCNTIAVFGISPKEDRDSHRVAKYLQGQGYKIIPLNPGQREILGERCYRTLMDIPVRVDIVNLFLNPVRVPPAVDQAIKMGAKVIWMQLDIVHREAAMKAREAGLTVVMNRCIMRDHMNIFV